MAVRTIALLGDPVLRKRCRKAEAVRDPGMKALITDLRDTVEEFRRTRGWGNAIAAPQIGVSKRVLFAAGGIECPGALINPVIERRSKRTHIVWDDCFSFPDLMVRVRRHDSITVRYTDESGNRRLLEARGFASDLLQHEIDHLDGILSVDRAIDRRSLMLRSVWEIQFRRS